MPLFNPLAWVREWLRQSRGSSRLVLVVVCVALLLDNMLLTVVGESRQPTHTHTHTFKSACGVYLRSGSDICIEKGTSHVLIFSCRANSAASVTMAIAFTWPDF